MGKIVLFLASIMILQLCIKAGEDITFVETDCDKSKLNYTNGGIYAGNLDLLFSELTSKAPTLKFYNYTEGTSPNQVFGFYLCREDIDPLVCNECVSGATRNILRDCSSSGGAAVFYIIVRYSDSIDIFSSYDVFPVSYEYSETDVSNDTEFDSIVEKELDGVINKASSSLPHFASSVPPIQAIKKLYSYAQCIPILHNTECDTCLIKDQSMLATVTDNNTRTFAMVIVSSCQLRYDMSPFLTPAPPPTLSSHPSPAGNNGVIIGATAGGILLLAIVLGICLCRRRKPKKVKMAKIDIEDIGSTRFAQYDFDTLRVATTDFSAESKLGEGGFGSVYKGTLETGELLAIKRLSGTGGQGTQEFMAEVRLLAKLQHRNLVRLVGFFLKETRNYSSMNLWLIQAWIASCLFPVFTYSDSKRRELLDWVLRHKIIMGIGRGLQYLHEDSRLTIIHRDLKTANILLDNKMIPKIADFGLAKLFEGVQKSGSTYRIVGTQGYMSPEYLLTGEYSDKSDVYSFGIMLLEIVCSRKNRVFPLSGQEDLSIQVWRLWTEKRSFEITDPVLHGNCSSDEVLRCIQIGLLCLQSNANERPTMTAVVFMLTSFADLPVPAAPMMMSPNQNYTDGQQSDGYQYSTNSVTMQTNATEDLFPVPR